MGIQSEFKYITPAELPTYIHTMSGVTNSAVAAKFITDAERIIDAYVGPAPRFYVERSGTTSVLLPSGNTVLSGDIFSDGRRPNYWAQGGVYIEVVDAGSATSLNGVSRLIESSISGTVTLASGFAVDLPAGSTFVFEQRSVFPRAWDVNVLSDPRLPDVLKQATALQVEYGIQFGSESFGLGDSQVATDECGDIQSRTYGTGYSESRNTARRQGLGVWIAPRARALLRRHLNATGWLRG